MRIMQSHIPCHGKGKELLKDCLNKKKCRTIQKQPVVLKTSPELNNWSEKRIHMFKTEQGTVCMNGFTLEYLIAKDD